MKRNEKGAHIFTKTLIPYYHMGGGVGGGATNTNIIAFYSNIVLFLPPLVFVQCVCVRTFLYFYEVQRDASTNATVQCFFYFCFLLS